MPNPTVLKSPNLTASPSTQSPASSAPAREPIRIIRRRFSYFPRSFIWRGATHEIDAVIRVNEKGGESRFTVTSANAKYVIVQDGHSWWIEAPPAAPEPAAKDTP